MRDSAPNRTLLPVGLWTVERRGEELTEKYKKNDGRCYQRPPFCQAACDLVDVGRDCHLYLAVGRLNNQLCPNLNRC